MEEAPLLLAVHGIVGGIEVEDELLRSSRKRGDEPIQDDRVNGHCRGPIGALLESAQRRARSPRRRLPEHRLRCKVVAQPVVIVEVFVALHQPVDPLAQHLHDTVIDPAGITTILQRLRHPLDQPKLGIRPAHQQQPRIRGYIAAIKSNLNASASNPPKQFALNGTIWHRWGLRRIGFDNQILCGSA